MEPVEVLFFSCPSSSCRPCSGSWLARVTMPVKLLD